MEEEFYDQVFSDKHSFDFNSTSIENAQKSQFLVPTMNEQISAVQNASVPASTARATTWNINLRKVLWNYATCALLLSRN